jgi:hypothetical protein
VASDLTRHTPILDEPPEDRQVALTKRLPSFSNYLANDVSDWAWQMTIVRDNALWRETDAVSWDDYCIRIVGKPLDWCGWIIGGYEALVKVRPGPIPEVEALEAGQKVAKRMAWAPDNANSKDGRVPPNCDIITVRSNTGGGTSADYLAARIKRDHPDIAAAVEREEYRSMRQAAIAAGIIKPPSRLQSAQKLWDKMFPDERDAFETYIAQWKERHQ